MFKIGQKVWSVSSGWGKVVETNDNGVGLAYPVYVEFADNNCDWYTADGKSDESLNRDLFFAELEIPLSALNPPIEHPEMKTGDVVMFKDGTFGWIAEYSGTDSNKIKFHKACPMSFEAAFDFNISYKTAVEKVIGSTLKDN